MRKYILNFIIVIFFSTLNCFSGELPIIDRLKFNQISMLNTLPSAEVQQVYRDREGLMWLATRSGLCSYDGYQVKTYRTSVFSPNLFISNNIYCVVEDYSHNLWVGTDYGLYVYSKVSGQMNKINLPNDNTVSTLFVTRDNNVWIGTNVELCRYNPIKKSIREYNIKNRHNLPKSFSVKSMLQDTNGDLLFGTWSSGLYRISAKTDNVQVYQQFNAHNSAHTLYMDNYGRLWIGTWGCGLYCMENPRNVKHPGIKSFVNNKLNPNSLPDDIVYSINEDQLTHTLWVGTRTGLSIMDLIHSDGSFVNYTTTSKQYPLPGNEINSVVTNGRGDFWLGTIGTGVLQTCTRQSFIHPYDLSSLNKFVSTNAVRCMYMASQNKIWIGVGSYGLALYDRSNNTSEFYTQMPEFAQIKQMPSIYSIVGQPDGGLWFATYGNGILVYHKGHPVKNLNSSNTKYIKDDCVLCLYRSKRSGVTWIGQRSGLSVMLRNNIGYKVNFMYNENREFSNCNIQHIMEDKSGNIWLATNDRGIIRISGDPYNPIKMKFQDYEPANNKLPISDITSIIQDSKSHIWAVSSCGGLFLLNPATDMFIPVNKIFHIPGDDARSIIEDHLGNLWIGTNYGIVKVTFSSDIMHPAIHIFTTADGLQDNYFIPNAVAKYNNELFFGDYKGFCSFIPRSMKYIDIANPRVTITDLKIYDRSYSELDSTLRKTISPLTPSFTHRILIPATCNNFTFEFSSLTYSHADQCKYAYMLDGFDNGFQYTDANKRFAYYSNLPSGKYKFHLRTTDTSGFWHDMPYYITVIVRPPFYATWWAYVIYALIIIGISYLAFSISRNRIRLQNSLRMEELEKKQIEMLNHAKLQFFTNITHELLTPLAIISASMEHLKMTIKQDTEDFSVMKNNINRLIRLIQQILEFRKAQSGNLKLKVSNGDITIFVKNEVESFYPLMTKKGLQITYKCSKTQILGYFDQDKLDKIIYNILSNAAKYNKENGAVHVFLDQSEDGNFIILSIKDNGIGMSDETKSHLFERFYDGEYRKNKTMGTGIGLSLTKDLVTLHGGTIAVDSELTKGTTFVITIPINRNAFKAEQIDEAEVDDMNIGIIAEHNVNENIAHDKTDANGKDLPLVLIVDDNVELLSLMKKLLETDYHVIAATDGEKALKVVQSNAVDVIVCDVMMPVMDGIQFTKYIKSNLDYCHIPIILLTAKTSDNDREDGYNSGADGYITKPFQLSVLQARIKNLLAARRRMQVKFKDKAFFELKELHYTDMDEDFLQRAINCVNNNLEDPEFDQARFVTEMGTSKSTLYNKLKSLTGLNTSSFINNIRLKAACKILKENPAIRVSDLAYMVGFNDPKYFSACFKKEYGMLVKDYIEKILNE